MDRAEEEPSIPHLGRAGLAAWATPYRAAAHCLPSPRRSAVCIYLPAYFRARFGLLSCLVLPVRCAGRIALNVHLVGRTGDCIRTMLTPTPLQLPTATYHRVPPLPFCTTISFHSYGVRHSVVSLCRVVHILCSLISGVVLI